MSIPDAWDSIQQRLRLAKSPPYPLSARRSSKHLKSFRVWHPNIAIAWI